LLALGDELALGDGLPLSRIAFDGVVAPAAVVVVLHGFVAASRTPWCTLPACAPLVTIKNTTGMPSAAVRARPRMFCARWRLHRRRWQRACLAFLIMIARLRQNGLPVNPERVDCQRPRR
jgi:hypothetical protein